jgi:hypothetical protein
MSNNSNPSLYVAKGKGTLADFNTAFKSSCKVDPDTKYENAASASTTTTSPTSSPTSKAGVYAKLANGALLMSALVVLILC